MMIWYDEDWRRTVEGSFIKLSVRMKCVRDFSDTYWDGRDDDDVGEKEIKKLSWKKNSQQPTKFPEIFRPRHSYFHRENFLKSTLFPLHSFRIINKVFVGKVCSSSGIWCFFMQNSFKNTLVKFRDKEKYLFDMHFCSRPIVSFSHSLSSSL